MTLKGNKGEWSELYTFLKLLADGRLYCGDGNLNRYDDKFYPILEMFRDDSPNRNTYKVQAAKNNILIVGETVNIEIPQERFRLSKRCCIKVHWQINCQHINICRTF